MKAARRSATEAAARGGGAGSAATAAAGVFISAQVPGVAHQRAHLPRGQGAMADGVLGRGIELGDGLAERRDEEQRVVAEAAAAARRRERSRRPAAGRRSAARDRRRGAAPPASQTKRARRSVRPCRRSSSSALLAASWARRSASRSAQRPASGAKCAEATPGAPPSASTHRPESSAIAAPPRGRAAWRALASAFSTKVACGSSASPMPSAPCATSSMPSGANSACSSASLPGLFEARTSLTPRTGRRAPPSAARCAATSSRDALAGEREQRVHLGAREGRALGRALQLDEAAGAGHDDVHVGVAGRVLDVLEVEQRRAVETMPTETAATASRIGERSILPLASSQRHRVVRRRRRRR